MTTESDWSACNISADSEASTFELLYQGTFLGNIRIPLFGNYNIMNALAATAAATHCGLPLEAITRAMLLFKRPKRRMEIVGTYARNVTLVEDFAHHPTAVRVTLEALGQLYAGRRIIACFEPRSNTTTRNIFQQELAECFGPASIVVMGMVHRPERYGAEQSLNTGLLRSELQKQGKIVFLAGENPTNYPDDIVDFLQSQLKEDDVVVLLSNGSFGNLKNLLTAGLKKNPE
jgi:UDP-N-acetylmuramate: L-alanyl-gamma-D-glutamyl-meso-diaminopimelate ligase